MVVQGRADGTPATRGGGCAVGSNQAFTDASKHVWVAPRQVQVQRPPTGAVQRLEVAGGLRQFQHAERIRLAWDRKVPGGVGGDGNEGACVGPPLWSCPVECR